MQIADNINDFVKKIIEAERETMNTPFVMFVRETPEVMKELGKHIWNKLRQEG